MKAQGTKCHVCSGGASLGEGDSAELREAQRAGIGAVQGAELRESLLASSCGCLGDLLIPAVLLWLNLGH